MTLSLLVTIIILLLTFVNVWITFSALSENSTECFKKWQKKLFFGSIGIIAVSFLSAILGISGVPRLNNCSSLLLMLAVSNILFFSLVIVQKIIPEKYLRVFSFTAKAIVIIFMLENTLFNFNAYDFLTHNYEQKNLDFSQAVINNGNINSDNSVTLYSSGTIEFTDIGIPIGSVDVECVNEHSASTEFKLRYSDETNAEYRNPFSFTVIHDNRKSANVYCAFSGKVSRLLFSVNAENVKIKTITLNQPITADIDPVRVAIFLGFVLLYYFLKHSEVSQKSVKTSRYAMALSTIVLSVVFVYMAFFSINIYRGNEDVSTDKEFSMETGNQMTYELVKAIEKGQVYLEAEVDDSLASLENPYDWSMRESNHVTSSWDHVYYNGKYYSYYGIAPVVLLFVPYHLWTGYYFPTVWAVFLFGAIGIIFLVKFFHAFVERYFSDISFGMSVGSCILMLCCCSVWFNFVTPNFYEIAQTSGFACITSGAYFLITSNLLDGKDIRYVRLTVSSVLLALSVLCRPTLAVYCIVGVLCIVFGFFRMKTSEKNKKNYVRYFCCSIIPYVVLGTVQMVYNYKRFGSVFDFGIDYSITINDFTRAESHLSQILIGFVNFLFIFPTVDMNFPFVHSQFTLLDLHGYYFVANTIGCGLLFKALPVFSYLYGGKAYRIAPVQYKKQNTVLLLATCILAPFVIIVSIAESGYGVRYATDFAWQIILGALVIAFLVYRNTENTKLRRIMEQLLLISVMVSVVIGFTQMYEYHIKNVRMIEIHTEFLNLARHFEFWK